MFGLMGLRKTTGSTILDLMENETLFRLGTFLVLFALFAVCEARWPKRDRVVPQIKRWITNWSLVLIDALALRLMSVFLPLLAAGAALQAQKNGWGFFNALDWPAWVEILLAILVLDLAIWAQHLLTHKIPILWRLHQVHHADRDVDVSTAIRFHPLEILFSMSIKILLVLILGPAVIAVVLFEIILNGTALFNHANFSLPKPVENLVRSVLVTPDMHRIHHSTLRSDHDSNYGFSLSIWDRMFRTYKPKAEQENVLGLRWQDHKPAKLGWSLMLPFRK